MSTVNVSDTLRVPQAAFEIVMFEEAHALFQTPMFVVDCACTLGYWTDIMARAETVIRIMKSDADLRRTRPSSGTEMPKPGRTLKVYAKTNFFET